MAHATILLRMAKGGATSAGWSWRLVRWGGFGEMLRNACCPLLSGEELTGLSYEKGGAKRSRKEQRGERRGRVRMLYATPAESLSASQQTLVGSWGPQKMIRLRLTATADILVETPIYGTHRGFALCRGIEPTALAASPFFLPPIVGSAS